MMGCYIWGRVYWGPSDALRAHHPGSRVRADVRGARVLLLHRDGIVVFRHNGTEVARTAASKVSPQGDASWSQTIDMDGRGLSPAEVLLDVRARVSAASSSPDAVGS